jgi:hypothetical protein
MSMNLQPDRVEHVQARSNRDAIDDRIVLRLSRSSLRAEPPVVQFIDRLTPDGTQRALWPA